MKLYGSFPFFMNKALEGGQSLIIKDPSVFYCEPNLEMSMIFSSLFDQSNSIAWCSFIVEFVKMERNLTA